MDKKNFQLTIFNEFRSFCGQRIRVTSARPRTRGHRRRFYTGSMRCFQCGMTGHFYRDCKENGHSRHDGRDSRDNRDGRDGRHRTSRFIFISIC